MKDPCLLYVGTGDGMYVFHARGEELALVGRGIEGNAVRGIAVHPQDSKTAYAACGLRGWGLYRTVDAGQTWELLGFEDRWGKMGGESSPCKDTRLLQQFLR
ncbi:hypothetical protein HRbin38_00259 [bacterium HR38]|nr:hypothetical protein HRbin38_00259 [bacterium HR38]